MTWDLQPADIPDLGFLLHRLAPDGSGLSYFRWVDDCLDSEGGSRPKGWHFSTGNSSSLMTVRGDFPRMVAENGTVDLPHDKEEKRLLRSYLNGMMPCWLTMSSAAAVDYRKSFRLHTQALSAVMDACSISSA